MIEVDKYAAVCMGILAVCLSGFATLAFMILGGFWVVLGVMNLVAFCAYSFTLWSWIKQSPEVEQ